MSAEAPDLIVSPLAVKLILAAEGLSHGEWPGGASGVTIGHGYDLGYHTRDEFEADWNGMLAAKMAVLIPAIGVKGEAARLLAAQIGTVVIPEQAARAVFMSTDLPRWIQRTAALFYGYKLLSDEAQGALVSLVFNRGTALEGENRREMKNIATLLSRQSMSAGNGQPTVGTYCRIASEIRSMKRLWAGKKLDGLLKRRDAEAALVEATPCVAKVLQR